MPFFFALADRKYSFIGLYFNVAFLILVIVGYQRKFINDENFPIYGIANIIHVMCTDRLGQPQANNLRYVSPPAPARLLPMAADWLTKSLNHLHRCTHSMLKGDSRLASSHCEIYVSLFQPATVVLKNFIKLLHGFNLALPIPLVRQCNSCFKEFHQTAASLKQLLRVGIKIRISQDTHSTTIYSPQTSLDKVTYSGVCPNSLESLSEDGRGAGGGEEFTAH